MSSVGNAGIFSGEREHGRSAVRFQDGECSLGTALWVILEKRCLKQGWMQETTRDTVFAVER